jgi:hypothetical protein
MNMIISPAILCHLRRLVRAIRMRIRLEVSLGH